MKTNTITPEQMNELMKQGLSLTLTGGNNVLRVLTTDPPPHDLRNPADTLLEGVTHSGLLNFIRSRKDEITNRKHETHLVVDMVTGSMFLNIGTGGAYRYENSDYKPSTEVHVEAALHPDYEAVVSLMSQSHKSAHDLAMKLRRLPHLFAFEHEWTAAVRDLRSSNVKIERIKRDTSDDSGAREKRLSTEIIEGQIDIRWSWNVPIYIGEKATIFECRAIYEANESITDVEVVLHNFYLKKIQVDASQAIVEHTLREVMGILGPDTIPIVFAPLG